MSCVLLLGDVRVSLKDFADNSIDSIVTDPPYGLEFMGKDWDAPWKTDRRQPFDGTQQVLKSNPYSRSQVRNGSGQAYGADARIMGAFQDWCEEWARECLRVLKPGGHMLAFGGSRTYHRLACAIENAGFEIRDQIMWLYGSGFPKSMNVSKAIDKTRVEDKEPIRAICRIVRAAMDAKELKSHHLTNLFGDCNPRLIDHWAARDTDSQPTLPTWEQWLTLRTKLGIGNEHDPEVWRLNDRKGQPGDTWANAEVIGEYEGSTGGFGEHRFSVRDNLIREASDAAKKWEGWGTALKPAHEPIVVARKPLIGTVAATVLEYGTGAINIDASRIPTNPEIDDPRLGGKGTWETGAMAKNVYEGGYAGDTVGSSQLGRFPANVIHDGSEEVLNAFPQTKSGSGNVMKESGADRKGNTGAAYGKESRPAGTVMISYGDQGSAARFFYCPKASKKDRGDGNNHPTVKPTELMRYLVRLVTPPGGTVLDPFMGSGTTGKAAVLEGFNFVGIELNEPYLEIAKARIQGVNAV